MNTDFFSTFYFTCIFALAAGAGAFLRYALNSFFQKIWGKQFPLGIFTVNILGCFVFGLIVGLDQSLQNNVFMLPENLKTILLTAFLGSFTTFSTFIFDADNFLKNKNFLLLIYYVMGQIFIGLLAFWGGTKIFLH